MREGEARAKVKIRLFPREEGEVEKLCPFPPCTSPSFRPPQPLPPPPPPPPVLLLLPHFLVLWLGRWCRKRSCCGDRERERARRHFCTALPLFSLTECRNTGLFLKRRKSTCVAENAFSPNVASDGFFSKSMRICSICGEEEEGGSFSFMPPLLSLFPFWSSPAPFLKAALTFF